MKTASTPAAHFASGHLVFPGSDWRFYERVLKSAGESPLRVNYSDGVLEIMTLSYEHERYKMAMHAVVMGLSLAFDINVLSGGSTTLKHRLKSKGLEPDQCYYSKHADDIVGRKQINLKKDPPPDLVLEIDLTHTAVDRERIYFEFGVPEMWTFDGLTIRGFRRSKTGWRRLDRSLVFPRVRIAELERFVPMFEVADVKLMGRVAKWAESKVD